MGFIRLKQFVTHVGRGKSPEYDDNSNQFCVNQACTSSGFVNHDKLKAVADKPLAERFILKSGDVLINSTGGGTLGKVAYVRPEDAGLTFDSHVTLVRLKPSYNPKFLYFYLSQLYEKINVFMAKGSTNQIELQKDRLLNFDVPNIPREQQDRAVEFLNIKVPLLDIKIATLERKIELYEEYKSSFLREIFPSYNLKRVGNNLMDSSKSKRQASEGGDDGAVPFFTSSQKQTKFIKEADFKGDQVILGTGGFANIHYSEQPFSTSTDCWVITNKHIYSKYLYYFLLSKKQEINELGFTGMGLKHLQRKFIKNLLIPLLDIENQVKLINLIDEKFSKIDRIIELTKQEIELQKEYKRTLINDVVTGKIEV